MANPYRYDPQTVTVTYGELKRHVAAGTVLEFTRAEHRVRREVRNRLRWRAYAIFINQIQGGGPEIT